MKDGRTHLAHKAEHAVDLETGALVGVTVLDADNGDTTTSIETLIDAAELYATGQASLKGLTAKAHAMGLTHPRSGHRMMKAQIHRILQNPIYMGNFRWLGRLHQGSHEPLVSREQFAAVQAVMNRKPRVRYPKQKHAFMGLLTCARCGCTMTAERKKGKYTYYRCTGFHGRCGNDYIREECLADLLGDVLKGIQIPAELADWIAEGLRDSQSELEKTRQQAIGHLVQRQRSLRAKLDRGYDDYLEGRISDDFWTRNSQEWESELATSSAELSRTGLLSQGNETWELAGSPTHGMCALGCIGGVDGTRTRGLRRDRPAF